MDNNEMLIEKAGKWGIYQKIVSIIVILTSLSLPMILLVLPMMQKEPEFSYYDFSRNITITDPTKFCSDIFYTIPFHIMSDKITIDSKSINNWAFELKLVCETRKILALVGTVFFLSAIGSNLAFSKFPDLYGRRKVFICLNILAFLSLFQLVYLKHLAQLIIAAFVMGFSSLNMAIGSVIISEQIDKKYSGAIMGIANAMFPFGGIIHTSIIFFLMDWRYYLYLLIVLFTIANVLAILYLKESPRWLVANQRPKEFIETIKFIAKLNGNISEIYSSHLTLLRRKSSISISEKDEEYRKHVYDMIDLLKYESLRLLTLKNLYLWIITGFSFFGLLLNLEGLTGNIYVDAFVTYFAEFLAEIASGIATHKFGRKKTTLASFIMATVGCVFFIIISYYPLKIALLFVSAIGIASGFNVLYIYSAELFPTNVKSLSMSVFSLFNRLAGGIIPILLTYTRNITFIFALMSAGAILVVITLPESLGYDPGDEVEEMKDMIYENQEDSNSNFLYFHDIFEKSF